jgi:hypothetical protein
MQEFIKLTLITTFCLAINVMIAKINYPFANGNPLMALLYFISLIPILIDFLISIFIKKEVLYKLMIPTIIHLGFIAFLYLNFRFNDYSSDHHFIKHLMLYNTLCFSVNFIYKLVQYLVLRKSIEK